MNKKVLIAIATIATTVVVGGVTLFVLGRKNENNKGSELENNYSENASTNDGKNNANKDLEYKEGYEYWGVKEMTAPTIPDVTYETKTVIPGVTVNISTTPFDYKIEDIYQKLKENDYMKQNYSELVKEYYEYDTGDLYNDAGHQMAYDITQSIRANLKTTKEDILKYTLDFSVNLIQKTEDYANTSFVSLHFNNLKEENINQKEMLAIAKIVFGEYAEYLVYGKDSNGYKYNSTTKMILDVELSERVNADIASYYLEREMEYDYRTETMNIAFYIGIDGNEKSNAYFKYYGLDNTSIYNSLTYNFEDILVDTFGARNPLEFSTFGNGYFKSQFPNYTRTILEYGKFASYTTESGRKASSFIMDIVGGDSTIARYESPELGLEFYVEEDNNGQINDLRIKATGQCYTYGNGDKKGQQAVNALISMIKRVFPTLDTSGITYVEGQKSDSCKKDISTTILGKNIYGTLRIQPNSGSFTINMSQDGEKF